MSYILDALRRADAERGRGAVPGLHTQAAPATGASPLPGRAGPTNLWLVAAGVVGAAVLAAGGTWWALRPQAPVADVVVAAAPAAPAPAAVAPAPATLPPPAPAPLPPPSPVPEPAPSPALAPLAPSEPRSASKRPADKSGAAPQRERERSVAAVVVAPPPAARAPAAEPPVRPRSPVAAPAPLAPAPRLAPEAGVAPPPASPVFAQADLPEALRTQLPALKVTGATHSNNPAYRMAIVNGQVLHEGDQAAPGLVLERIEPGRTVWSFRGYRYGVAAQ